MALSPHLSPEELAAYLDRRASRPDWKRITGHLATCDTCFRELLAVMRLMRDRPADAGDSG
jgi:anti-sigma factor RsiW